MKGGFWSTWIQLKIDFSRTSPKVVIPGAIHKQIVKPQFCLTNFKVMSKIWPQVLATTSQWPLMTSDLVRLLAYPQLLQTKTHFGDGFITLNMRFYSVILYRCSFSIFDVKKNVRFRCSLDLNRLFGHIRVEKNERVDHIQLCTSK